MDESEFFVEDDKRYVTAAVLTDTRTGEQTVMPSNDFHEGVVELVDNTLKSFIKLVRANGIDPYRQFQIVGGTHDMGLPDKHEDWGILVQIVKIGEHPATEPEPDGPITA